MGKTGEPLDLTNKVAALKISDSTFPLLGLPELVLNNVLKFLRVWELMDLRLVCKSTKKWVDDSHLDKLVLCIKSHSQIESILAKNSAPGWSFVKILCDSEMHNQDWIKNPLYINLLQKLGPSLTKLILEGHRVPHEGLSSILSTCKSLRHLEIGILDCKNWAAEPDIDNQEMAASLSILENLSFGYLAWNEESDLKLFEKILSHCKSLITLKAPHILMASLFKIGDTDDEDEDKKYLELVLRRLVEPLVGYLKKRLEDSTSGEMSFRLLDVENLHHSEIFPILAGTCYRANVRLLNVSEAFEFIVPAAEIPFAEAIESLNGFTNQLNFHKLINLRTLKLDTETSADSAVGKEWIEAKLPKLKIVELCLPEDIDDSILKCLLKQSRPSVTSLRIEFEVEEPKLSTLFIISDIVNNFKNLQEISLVQWDGNDNDLIPFFKTYTRLRSLRLQKCFKITDKGLMGEDSTNPGLSNLKDLKKLWLDCCISDLVLREVSQMRVEEFFYSSPKVTTAGFSALADGPFANSVIIFQGSQPDDCSDKDFNKVLKRFKNLKKSPSWFET